MNAPQWNGEPGAVSSDPERQGRKEFAPLTDIPAGVCARSGCDRSLNFFRVTIAGVGEFCSRNCADKAQQLENPTETTMVGEGQGRR